MRNVYCYWSDCRKEHILENLEGDENGNMNIMFCWPCISIYSFLKKKKPTWCTIYLQYILSNTSTCFRRIYSPSSGGTTVWIQQLVLVVLFSWLSVVMTGPKWNILKINCASSWFFFKWKNISFTENRWEDMVCIIWLRNGSSRRHLWMSCSTHGERTSWTDEASDTLRSVRPVYWSSHNQSQSPRYFSRELLKTNTVRKLIVIKLPST